MQKATEAEKQSVSMAVMATDINYIKLSITKIEKSLLDMDGHYVRIEEFNDHLKDNAEFRVAIREMEIFKTQVKTWGAAAVIALGIAEFLINRFG